MMITKINDNKVAQVTQQPFDSATTSARPADSEKCWKTPKLLESFAPSSAYCRSGGPKTNTTTEIFLFRVQGRLCALNDNVKRKDSDR